MPLASTVVIPVKMQEPRASLNQPVPCAHLKPLRLVEALSPRSMDGLRHGSPWDQYVMTGETFLEGDVSITNAQPKGAKSVLVTIQSTTWTPAVSKRLALIWTLMHDNLSAVRDVFIHNKKVYVVYESFPISLEDMSGHGDLTETRLVTILAQVGTLGSMLSLH